MSASRTTLSIPDYVVFALVLLISAAIGIYYGCTGGRQKSTREFLMANRQMGVLPVALSLLASFMSAITLLGTPAEMYQYGTQYYLIVVSYILVMVVAGHVLLPVFYRLGITSAYEYLEKRFHKVNRTLGCLTFLLQMTIYMGIVLYAPSLALEAVTDLPWTFSVIAMAIVCTFYTTFGGMKAVMWTDVFQILVMFGGMLAVVIRGFNLLGGFESVWNIAENGQRLEFNNFSPDPLVRHTVWSLVIGGAFTWLTVYGVNQSQVQRYCTSPTMRQAQIALWLNLPGLVGLLTLCCLAGLVIYAYYANCDPLLTKRVNTPDQLLPLFVMDTMSFMPGFPGLFIATIFSGALSTVSSGLNSLAAVTLEDLIKPYCKCCGWLRNLNDERAATISKILAVGYGLLALLLAFLASLMGDTLQAALGLFGIVGGPLLGVFLLGVLFPCANWKGATAGHIAGLFLSLWIGVGSNVYKFRHPKAPVGFSDCSAWNVTVPESIVIKLPSVSVSRSDVTTSFPNQLPAYNWLRPEYEGLALYRVSYMWIGAIAVSTAVVVGLIVSLITGPTDASKLNPNLICPVLRVFCPFLPERFLKLADFGVYHDFTEHNNRGEAASKSGVLAAWPVAHRKTFPAEDRDEPRPFVAFVFSKVSGERATSKVSNRVAASAECFKISTASQDDNRMHQNSSASQHLREGNQTSRCTRGNSYAANANNIMTSAL